MTGMTAKLMESTKNVYRWKNQDSLVMESKGGQGIIVSGW